MLDGENRRRKEHFPKRSKPEIWHSYIKKQLAEHHHNTILNLQE